jgi:RNA polymerase sigma-70 factor (sigma-E family)
LPSQSDEDYVEYVTARLPALKRLAYQLCGDDHRADDLVQESVTKLYTRWSSAHRVDNLDAYVRAILVRTHIDETRRPWSRVRLFGALPDHQGAAGPAIEDRSVLRAALAALPAGQRAVLVLRFLCDLPVAEVGELLGCSEGTVKSQTAHGLAKLRQALGTRAFAMITKGN